MHLETQYNFTRSQLEAFAASTMVATIGHLVSTKVIDETSGWEIVDSTTPVIVLKESMIDRLRKLVFKDKPPKDMIDIRVKFVTFKPE